MPVLIDCFIYNSLMMQQYQLVVPEILWVFFILQGLFKIWLVLCVKVLTSRILLLLNYMQHIVMVHINMLFIFLFSVLLTSLKLMYLYFSNSFLFINNCLVVNVILCASGGRDAIISVCVCSSKGEWVYRRL